MRKLELIIELLLDHGPLSVERIVERLAEEVPTKISREEVIAILMTNINQPFLFDHNTWDLSLGYRIFAKTLQRKEAAHQKHYEEHVALLGAEQERHHNMVASFKQSHLEAADGILDVIEKLGPYTDDALIKTLKEIRQKIGVPYSSQLSHQLLLSLGDAPTVGELSPLKVDDDIYLNILIEERDKFLAIQKSFDGARSAATKLSRWLSREGDILTHDDRMAVESGLRQFTATFRSEMNRYRELVKSQLRVYEVLSQDLRVDLNNANAALPVSVSEVEPLPQDVMDTPEVASKLEEIELLKDALEELSNSVDTLSRLL